MKMKKIAITLEFHLRGKKNIPAVSFIGAEGYGVPLTGHNEESAAFDEFSKAAHRYCKAIADAGELK